MNLSSLRRNAQIALAVIAVLAAAGSGYRYLVRGGSIFADHVTATPASGPVGMRPFFEFPGYPGGKELTVYMCTSATGGVEGCAELGKGKAGERLQSAPIPAELPDTSTVEPGTYVLRAGPDDDGAFPKRGEFEVVPFTVGSKVDAPSFANLRAADFQAADPRRLARGVQCRPPSWLRDGRIVIGSTIFDPQTNVSIEFKIPGRELVWSPVGDKLAILTEDRKEIQLAAPDGSGATTRVREARGLLSSLSWSPDGAHLAYIAERDPSTRQLPGDPGPPTVVILNATNGERTQAGPGLSVAWSPDVEVLAVERADSKIEASTPSGERRPLVDGRRPAWSHDGRFLTVVRSDDGGTRGWIVPAAGGGGVAITGNGGCAMSFAPSGRALAVVASLEGEGALQYRPLQITGIPDAEA